MANPGNPASLQPQPGNTFNLKHGAYSPRLLSERAEEISQEVLRAPWACELDRLGALEIGRLEALIEKIDQAIEQGGITGKGGQVKAVVDIRIRASRRLTEVLALYGLLPHARASWAAALGGSNLSAEIARRRGENGS